MTVVTVCSSTVVLVSRPVGADSITDAKAKAAQIESELANAQSQMSALSQQYDAARVKLDQVDSDIATTKAAIAVNQAQVSKDKTILEKAAIANYVSDGAAATENPIFSNNEKTIGAATEYNQIASGDINQAVANLHTAENKLAAQQAQLTAQQGQAQSAVSAEQAAVTQNQQVVQEQSNALAQENGQIATLVQQQAAAEAAQAAQASAAKLAAAQAAAAAPSSGGGGGGGGGGPAVEFGRRQSPTGRRRRFRGSGRGRKPDRRALRLGRRDPRGRLRLLGIDGLVLGPSRRLAPSLLGGADGGLHPGTPQ